MGIGAAIKIFSGLFKLDQLRNREERISPAPKFAGHNYMLIVALALLAVIIIGVARK